jgi:hypothetical protein
MTKSSESVHTSDLVNAFTGIGNKKFVGKNLEVISQIKSRRIF